MQIKDIMSKEVRYMKPDATVEDAAIRMKEYGIGAMPITQDGKVTGILTDRDIVLRAVAEFKTPKDTPVKEIMSSDKIFDCKDTDSLKDAAEIMKKNQVRRLVVKDENGSFAGLVSVGDIVLAGDKEIAAETIREISQPAVE